MKKLLFTGLVLVTVIIGIILYASPIYVASSMNQISGDHIPVSDKAEQLHQTMTIADLHADSLLWRRDLVHKADWGHADIPRLIEGNVAVQTFSVVTKVPENLNIHSNAGDSDKITLLAVAQGWPVGTWNSLLQRALYQARKLHRFADRSRGSLHVIKTQADLIDFLQQRMENPDLTAGVLALEGAHALEGDLSNIYKLEAAGYRMMAPTHFFDTQISGSAHGKEKGGLTELGVQWVHAMNRHHLIIDLAHASGQTIRDVLKLSDRPVVVSHTGLKGHCTNDRNIPDDLARKITDKGGLIGIGYWPTAVCGDKLNDIAGAIRYAADLLGEDHVALGSDFDGAVTTPIDASQLAMLTQALMNEGMSAAAIRKVMGANLIRFYLEHLPSAD